MAFFPAKTDKPTVSVIMPFYNAEKYIGECLNSIITGTKIRCEIICVDDGSTDSSAEIVKEYCAKNNRVRLVTLPKNKGLYLARLTGVKQARGKYIGFVDSDDQVSQGYFDKLYYAARLCGADIAVGQVVNIDLKGIKYVQTRCGKFPYLNGERRKRLYEMYWRQSGRCYHWHVVWNKLYRRKLWDMAIPVLERQTNHLVMLEDFIFSSVVLAAAKKYITVTSARYFYIAHSGASISANKNFFRMQADISDMCMAFEFVEAFLQNTPKYMCFIPFLKQWRERYGRYWQRNIEKSRLSQAEQKVCVNVLEGMTGGKIGQVTDEDEYFYGKAVVIE